MVEPVPDEVLRAFGFSGADVTMFERGLINRHWLAVRRERKLVFRRYHPSRTREAIAWEQALVRHAAERAWPVPLALPDVEGRDLIEHEGRLWSCHPFLEGEAELDPAAEHYRRLGEYLARLHADIKKFPAEGQRPGFAPVAELDSWFSIAGEGFDQSLVAFEHEHPELGASIRARCADVLADLSRMSFDRLEALPIHGDFHRFNLLWCGDVLSGVLDFDMARRDAQVCDLAVALVPFMPLGEAEAAALLRGYESHRRLSADERELLIPLARAELLGWVSRLLGGWRSGNLAAIAGIARTLTVRLPAVDDAASGWRVSWRA